MQLTESSDFTSKTQDRTIWRRITGPVGSCGVVTTEGRLSTSPQDASLADLLLRAYFRCWIASNTDGWTRCTPVATWEARRTATVSSVEPAKRVPEEVKASVTTAAVERPDEELPPQIAALRWIKEQTGLSDKRVAKLLRVTRQTLHRWNDIEKISDDNARRILATREVLERAAEYSKTADALRAWLDTPRSADGRTPSQMLENDEIGLARLYAVARPLPHALTRTERSRRRTSSAFTAPFTQMPETPETAEEREIAALAREGGIYKEGHLRPIKRTKNAK